ncbi:glycosyltransferase family 2 protein [Flavobacteriales bacterium]|jgi:GT2 family glycosyltransferase|nr:glycosyltransferase family 2 protein [Flavobacteriales bacterium]
METPTKVAVVILNYNGIHWLKKFLGDVVLKSPTADVYVADNASTDNSVKYIKTNFPNVKLVQNKSNEGYAGGYNNALQRIKSDYYVLLNSDVEVTENWLSPIINLMDKDKSIAACQPKIKKYDNKSSFEYAGACGGYLDKYGYPFCRGRVFDTLEEDDNQYDEATEVFWASGACLFLRSTPFYEVGGFDWDFFAHMEEIDLCWRLKNKGYKIMCEPKSTVYHVGGGTLNSGSTFKSFLNYRNNLLMLYKNLAPEGRFSILFTRMLLDGISSVKFIINGKPQHIFSILKAHIKYYTLLKTFKKKRPQNYSAKLFPKSVVYLYFVKKLKTYNQLNKDFS